MLDLLSKTWRLLLIPLSALAFFFGAYFFYYSGDYDPPPTVALPIDKIAVPSSSFSEFEEAYIKVYNGDPPDGSWMNLVNHSPQDIQTLRIP